MDADPTIAARQALACLDLTSLNDADDEATVERLCARAQGRFGPVAAVCVWPRLAAFARRQLPPVIPVAAVANFPDGGTDLARAERDVGQIVDAGAQEVDVVLPWRALIDGDTGAATRLLAAARRTSAGLRLKVILETGMLDSAQTREASRIALGEGADFLKTSTGKTPHGATPEAARVMLQSIAADARAAGRAGFKASGGVRSVTDAAVYIDLVESTLGADALVPARFRIGASALLDDIEAVLAGRGQARATAGY